MLKSVWIKSAAFAVIGLGGATALLRAQAATPAPAPTPGAAPPAAAPATAPAAAAEWPKWLGPNGNGISQEKIADQWPEAGPKKLWSATVGKGYSSAVAQDNKIYFFSQDDADEVLTCFDADTGAKVWSEAYKGGYPNRDYPGARTTPTIDGDKIYTYGGGGHLVCRELKTGKEVWNLQILKATGSKMLQWGQASSPLIVGDLVIVQAGEDGPIAAAVNKKTGRGVWESQAKGKAGYAMPILINVDGKQQLIVFGGGALYGMEPETGKTLWEQPWKTNYDVNAATPIYDGKGNLFVTSGYTTGGGMFKVSATGAQKLWGPERDLLCKFQPPILDGNTLYIVTESKRGTIKAAEWPTGKIIWELKEPKVGYGGSFVRVGDKLIAQGQQGDISLIKATPEAGEMISTFKPFDDSSGKVWSMPIVYKGKLYAKGPEELVCFDIK